MMKERISHLAKRAGLGLQGEYWLRPINQFYIKNYDLKRFAELIRLDETEACAKQYLEIMRDAVEQAVLKERAACADLCDEEANQSNSDHEAGGMYWCAEAIRARGNHDTKR